MNAQDAEAEVQRALQRGRRHLRRARIVAAVLVSVILFHLLWLLIPCAREAGGFASVAMLIYPVALGVFAMGPLYHASLWR